MPGEVRAAVVAGPEPSGEAPGGACGVGAVPVRPMLVSPASVVRPTEPLKRPGAVGLMVTPTLTTWPGSITAPTLGRPPASNGAGGPWTAVTLRGVPPLVNETSPVRWTPTGTMPKPSALVERVST